MNRRAYLAGLVACSAGCLERGVTGTTESATGPAPSGDLRIAAVYADEVERTFFDYEYVRFENVAGESLDVSGYTVDYGDDRTYAVADLVLEPGATLVVSSRSGRDTILDRAPPIYHRFAGFGSGTDTSVLGETATVVVRDAGGTTVSRADYTGFGCDGGTLTVEPASDEPSC